MKTIKIIDLLNMIANGEEVPKEIEYQTVTLVYDENECEYSCIEEFIDFSKSGLNDEVEIIEESDDKNLIEKFTEYTSQVGRVDESNIEDYIHVLFEQQSDIICRLNNIIDYLMENKDE